MKAPGTLFVSADSNGLGTLVGALAVATAGAVTLAFVQLGPLSGHMVAHIAAMNVVAPIAAVGTGHRFRKPLPRTSTANLWLATLGQMALLWRRDRPYVEI